MHDLVAELRGYRAELAGAVQYGRTDRAEAVTREVGRVEQAVRERAAELRKAAAGVPDGAGRFGAELSALDEALVVDVPAVQEPAAEVEEPAAEVPAEPVTEDAAAVVEAPARKGRNGK